MQAWATVISSDTKTYFAPWDVLTPPKQAARCWYKYGEKGWELRREGSVGLGDVYIMKAGDGVYELTWPRCSSRDLGALVRMYVPCCATREVKKEWERLGW